MNDQEQHALMMLRVQLYAGAQKLEGGALEELKQIVREIVMVLDIDREKPAGLESGRALREKHPMAPDICPGCEWSNGDLMNYGTPGSSIWLCHSCAGRRVRGESSIVADVIAAGDVVRRKNSPQLMTVAEVHVSDGRPFAASCTWFVELDVNEWSDVKRRLFDVDDLEVVRLQSACRPRGMPAVGPGRLGRT